jgi:hypothetical protein
VQWVDNKSGHALEQSSITSLVIVPHRDLAYQLHHWISRIIAASELFSPPPLSSISQILVREGTMLLASRISKLREDPPHILIGTPQALLEVFNEDRGALRLESLSTVVVDEVDYLIESVPRKPSQKMMKKARRKLDRHLSPTRQLLDTIYASRVNASTDSAEDDRSRREVHLSHSPQLIMSSATLRNHLKVYLFNESGWLRKERLQKVVGSRNDQQGGSFKAAKLRGVREMLPGTETGAKAQHTDQDGTGISHYVLVVSGSGDIANIEGATRAEAPENSEEIVSTEDSQTITPATLFNSPEPPDAPGIDEKLTESAHYFVSCLHAVRADRLLSEFMNTASPFNPNTLEAIATAFALDVPSIALLVLPASAPVQRAVYELRGMGVNAQGLDLMMDGKGRGHLLNGGAEDVENPTLLVSTLATTRGLDLPELTHVFILGILEGRAVDGRTLDTYLHLAGRVGRFGRKGKVITMLESAEEEEGDKKRDDVSRMKKVLKELGIAPRQFEHFD